MANSGNGDSTRQKVSKFGAIRLAFDELGDDASTASVRKLIAERFGYTVNDRDIVRVRNLRRGP